MLKLYGASGCIVLCASVNWKMTKAHSGLGLIYRAIFRLRLFHPSPQFEWNQRHGIASLYECNATINNKSYTKVSYAHFSVSMVRLIFEIVSIIALFLRMIMPLYPKRHPEMNHGRSAPSEHLPLA